MTKARDNANGGLGLILIKPTSVTNGTVDTNGRVTFSNVSNLIVDNVFDTKYKVYRIMFEKITASTDTDDLHFQLRRGSTTQTTAYYCSTAVSSHSSATFSNINSNNVSQYTMHNYCDFFGHLDITGVGHTAEYPKFWGTADDFAQSQTLTLGGNVRDSQTFTGFLIKSSSTNITGSLSIYGYKI